MAILDTSTYAALLKKFYNPGKVQNMVYKKQPWFAMVPKSSKMPGTSLETPVQYEDSQNRSANFSDAASGATTLQSVVFSVAPQHDYGLATIDGELIRAAESNEGAFMRAGTNAIGSVINGLTRSWAAKMWRTGFGELGTITVSGSTFTLANIQNIVHFSKGQRVVFSASTASDALRSATALNVTAVNRATGVVTCDATMASVGATNGDTVFCLGDREDSATPTKRCVTGFQGWVPASAPTSASFFGVDRSADVTRLGGLRQSSAGQAIEEAIIDAAMLAGREGWNLSHLFMNYAEYANLLKMLSSKVEIDIKTDMPNISFSGIKVWGAGGAITVVPDGTIPPELIAGVTMDTWLLRSRGEPIGVLDEDGLGMLRHPTLDAYTMRYGGYGNLTCNAPGANINIAR